MRKVALVLSILLLISGVAVFTYPHIQQHLYRRHAAALISDFESRLDFYRTTLTRPPAGIGGENSGEGENSNGYQPGNSNGSNSGYESGNSSEGNSGNSGENSNNPGNPGQSSSSGSNPDTNPLYWLYELMAEYNQRLFDTRQSDLVDPFSYEQPNFDLSQFGIEDEDMIGYISIPRMNVDLPIFLGASDENLLRGAAHMTQTSLPLGGLNTNSAIAAHRGMGTAAMFRDIHLLEIGDEIFITNFHGTLRYAVVEIRIVWPSEISVVHIQPGRDLITLVSCHPYRRNYQRYIVFAERVEDTVIPW